MKTKIIVLLIVLLTNFIAFSQDCAFYTPNQEGTVLERKTYNQRNKHLSTVTTIVRKVEKTDISTIVTVDMNIKLVHEDSAIKTTHIIRCENGKFYMDMLEYEGKNSLITYKDEPIVVQSENPIPSHSSPNTQGGRMSLKVGLNYAKSLEVNMANVKVIGNEIVTTEAGTFNCYKISYDLDTKVALFKQKTKVIEWYTKGIGIIRRESYTTRGKLIDYSILTRITNNELKN